MDLTTAMMWSFAVYFTLVYVMEWLSTGTWQWSWQRDAFLLRDWFSLLLFVGIYVAVYQYFWQHLRRGKPTVGQFAMGYRIIAKDDGNLRERLHRSIIVLLLWPIALFYPKVAPGVYHWDKKSRTRAVSTRAS